MRISRQQPAASLRGAFHHPVRSGLAALAAALIFAGIFAGGAARAATLPPSLPGVVSLNDGQEIYGLGRNAYVTSDETSQLSYTSVVEGHLGNNRGLANEYGVVTLGASAIPHWIVFAVKNNARTTGRWVFSLGTHADGRYGTASRLFIYDHFERRYLLYAMPDQNGALPSAARLPMNGAGIPFELAPGAQTLLVAYIVPQAGAPVTITPQIMTEQAFWRSQNMLSGDQFVVAIALLGTIGFFAGMLVLRPDSAAAGFILYLIVQLLTYVMQNNVPVSDNELGSETTLLWMDGTAVAGLLLARLFLNIPHSARKESLIVYAAIFALIVVPLLSMFLVPASFVLRPAILIALPLGGYLLLAMLSLAQIAEGKPGAMIFSIGWAVQLAGAATTLLATTGLIPPTRIMINAYWSMLLFQIPLFLMAACVRNWVMVRQEKSLDLPDEEEEETLARIRQAKDSSENARLLKVIDHERQMLQELRDRELQQNEEMRRAKEDADLANRAKSAFLAVISHEIRTPMSGIMGMVRLLLDSGLSKQQRDYARTIQDSGDAMLALLNDILDFEKIETGKMGLEMVDFDLPRLVNDIMTLMSGHASQKGIGLRADIAPDVPRFVRGDPVRLRQVLLNLTGNAVKFTGEGNVTVTVKRAGIEAAGAKPGLVRLYFGIRDTGIGISKEAQKNLFNPFSQADTSISRKYGGSGLGLAICQRLIEAMGGKIAIDSVEGEGSTFFFTLALEDGQAERAEDVSGSLSLRVQNRPEKALRVLCVDDNDINQKLMSEFVARLGHHPVVAGTGEEALQIFAAEPFDAVLMDIELPGISGIGATRAIRAMPDRARAATPIIALTGNVRDEDIRRCYAANMNGHLAKPLEPEKLKVQLDKVIHGTLDNPVLLEQSGEADMPASAQEVRIDESRAAAPASLSLEGEHAFRGAGRTVAAGGNLTAVRAYALQAEAALHAFSNDELDEDSFADAISQGHVEAGGPPEPAQPQQMQAHFQQQGEMPFDYGMLDSLKTSMKRQDLREMIDGLVLKNDEILGALQTAIGSGDAETIVLRSHELKGMCGNFGLREMSELAARMEKAAKSGTPDGFYDIFIALTAANDRANAAVERWLAS